MCASCVIVKILLAFICLTHSCMFSLHHTYSLLSLFVRNTLTRRLDNTTIQFRNDYTEHTQAAAGVMQLNLFIRSDRIVSLFSAITFWVVVIVFFLFAFQPSISCCARDIHIHVMCLRYLSLEYNTLGLSQFEVYPK